MAPISDKLRKSIGSSGESLYRLAKQSGVDYSIVLRFHHGERDVTLATADKLAAHLGLELKRTSKSRSAERSKESRKAPPKRR